MLSTFLLSVNESKDIVMSVLIIRDKIVLHLCTRVLSFLGIRLEITIESESQRALVCNFVACLDSELVSYPFSINETNWICAPALADVVKRERVCVVPEAASSVFLARLDD